MPLNGPNATTWSKDRPGPGRTPGAKNKLQRKFLEDLRKEWEEHGAGVLRIARIEEPVRFLQIVASLMPKELLIGDAAVEAIDDDELELLIAHARQLLKAPQQEPKLIGEEKAGECLTVQPNRNPLTS
jgi:hypothetical protein